VQGNESQVAISIKVV